MISVCTRRPRARRSCKQNLLACSTCRAYRNTLGGSTRYLSKLWKAQLTKYYLIYNCSVADTRTPKHISYVKSVAKRSQFWVLFKALSWIATRTYYSPIHSHRHYSSMAAMVPSLHAFCSIYKLERVPAGLRCPHHCGPHFWKKSHVLRVLYPCFVQVLSVCASLS